MLFQVWLSVFLLLGMVVTGFGFLAGFSYGHIWFGFLASGFSWFTHVRIFIHMRSKRKLLAEKIETEAEPIPERAALLRRRLYPHLFLFSFLLLATVVSGMIYEWRVWGEQVHAFLSYATMVYAVHVALLETFSLVQLQALEDEREDAIRWRELNLKKKT